MAITILPPVADQDSPVSAVEEEEQEDDQSSLDSDGDYVVMERETALKKDKKQKRRTRIDIVTPGELVTDDQQWMRFGNFRFWFLLYRVSANWGKKGARSG